MAEFGLASSSVPAAAARRALPLLPPIALIGAGWLMVALMPQGDAAPGPLAGLFMDQTLRDILATLCRSGVAGDPWLRLGGNLAMWGAMILAMMLPCAVPAWRMLLRPGAATGGHGFMLGYCVAWGGFAVVAAAIGTVLQSLPDARSGLMPAALILAGLHQLGPAKAAAIRALHRGGDCAMQPARSGLSYGRQCIEADALPMGIMLAFGSTDLIVMLGLAALMLLEKVSPSRLPTRASGVVLIGLGAGWLTGLPP